MYCSLGATRELSGRSLGALWELVAVAGIGNMPLHLLDQKESLQMDK